MADSELKVGMRGTWENGVDRFAAVFIGPSIVEYGKIVVEFAFGDEGWLLETIDKGAFFPEPDPTPPSTVKVEMSVEDARVWKDISAIANWQQLARLQEAARAALRAEGLE